MSDGIYEAARVTLDREKFEDYLKTVATYIREPDEASALIFAVNAGEKAGLEDIIELSRILRRLRQKNELEWAKLLYMSFESVHFIDLVGLSPFAGKVLVINHNGKQLVIGLPRTPKRIIIFPKPDQFTVVDF